MTKKITNLDNIPDFGETPTFAKVKINQHDWKDGIVVRAPNWLGDAIMAIPAMMQLKQIVPENCGFFVVVPPGLKELFASLDFVDMVIPLHKAHSPWSRKDIKSVKLTNPGIGLLMNNSLRDAFYLKVARVPRLYGAAARGRSFLLKESFNFPKIENLHLNKLHHAGRYLSMVYALGAPAWNGELPQFNNLKEQEITTSEVLALLKCKKVLVVAPGAAYGEAKRWPSKYFNEVCSFWIKNGGSVAIIGTKAEEEVAKEVAKGLPEDKVHNLTGKTDMQDLLNILKHADMCVANDSGVMHMSAILGKKGVAIFGSTDPTSTSPVSRKWKILYKKQKCAPCFGRTCPFGTYKCLRDIEPEMVIKEIKNGSKTS